MSRIALASIPALTFYKDSLTASRRADPIPQLSCTGKPCDWYQPDVVRCENAGGRGTEIDWKCEADLPESLRLGRVEVSCEGWTGPGDPYVLKGSCGLTYRLVHVPDNLRNQNNESYIPRSRSWSGGDFFMLLWLGVLLFILWGMFKASRTPTTPTPTGTPRPPRSWPWSNFGAPSDDPPPPYPGGDPSPKPSASTSGWTPGFWTGTALGAAGTYLMGQGAGARNRRYDRGGLYRDARAYDWERERSSAGRQTAFSSNDRGEGPSNLGATRRSTGFGGSSVR